MADSPTDGFRTLDLSRETIRSLAAMGFDEPTPIQAQAIPCLLEGRDVVAQAMTGTGKTAAFGIPLVERIDAKRAVPQALVLTPTRELTIQVTDQLCKIGHQRGLAILPIYGGQPYDRQLRGLRHGIHAIVATPGRLLDHLRRGSADLGQAALLVLDEADQMLEMGFIDDVEAIIAYLPAERVTALFSATMPDPIVELARRHMREPEMIRLSRPESLIVPEIDQLYYEVPFRRKLDALCRVLDVERPERTIVFCATKRMVDEVVEGLQARGYFAEGLHGDITQSGREKILRGFRAGRSEVLVATDVAARGLDIPEVSHVVNFDIPNDAEYYVHRIGRTGRLGRSGRAITFVNPREMRALKIIQRMTGARIRREEVPTVADVEEREAEILAERLMKTLLEGNWGRYRALVEEVVDDHDPVDVAAAALSLVAARPAGAPTRPAERTGAGSAAEDFLARPPAPPEFPADERARPDRRAAQASPATRDRRGPEPDQRERRAPGPPPDQRRGGGRSARRPPWEEDWADQSPPDRRRSAKAAGGPAAGRAPGKPRKPFGGSKPGGADRKKAGRGAGGRSGPKQSPRSRIGRRPRSGG